MSVYLKISISPFSSFNINFERMTLTEARPFLAACVDVADYTIDAKSIIGELVEALLNKDFTIDGLTQWRSEYSMVDETLISILQTQYRDSPMTQEWYNSK